MPVASIGATIVSVKRLREKKCVVGEEDGGRIEMTGRTHGRPNAVVTDLVGYLVIVTPDIDSMGTVGQALADLVRAATIRVLDVLVIGKAGDGTVEVFELEAVESLRALSEMKGEIGGLLSDHDAELVAMTLKPGTACLIVVTEDHWAEPLSAAARRAGGLILAGERVPAARVEAVLAEADPLGHERLGGLI